MQSNYIVSTGSKLYAFYYVANPGSGIYCRIFEANKWQKPFLLAANVRDSYSVNLSSGGRLYIFVQEHTGDIKLYTGQGSKWSGSVILRNQSPVVQPVLLNAMITETGGKQLMSIIYNAPVKEDKTQFLVTQKVTGDGVWSSPSRVDKMVNLPHEIYHKQNIAANHCVVFYTTRTPDTNIGYREFTSERVGGFHLIHTGGTLSDYSFLTTDEGIHALLLVKTLFSSQLIYRKKTDTGFSAPVTVWEGQRISGCLLYIIRDDLYASFSAGGQLYVCKSYDSGETFERPVKYKYKFCQSPVKASFIFAPGIMSESEYYCREMYVDSENPHDIQILPELYEDFYPIMSAAHPPEPIQEKESQEEKNAPAVFEEKDYYDPFAGMQFTETDIRREPPSVRQSFNDDMMLELFQLKNQLMEAVKQNAEKDRQINELLEALNNDGDEA